MFIRNMINNVDDNWWNSCRVPLKKNLKFHYHYMHTNFSSIIRLSFNCFSFDEFLPVFKKLCTKMKICPFKLQVSTKFLYKFEETPNF